MHVANGAALAMHEPRGLDGVGLQFAMTHASSGTHYQAPSRPCDSCICYSAITNIELHSLPRWLEFSNADCEATAAHGFTPLPHRSSQTRLAPKRALGRSCPHTLPYIRNAQPTLNPCDSPGADQYPLNLPFFSCCLSRAQRHPLEPQVLPGASALVAPSPQPG